MAELSRLFFVPDTVRLVFTNFTWHRRPRAMRLKKREAYLFPPSNEVSVGVRYGGPLLAYDAFWHQPSGAG